MTVFACTTMATEENKIETTIRSNATFVNRDYFAYTVNRDEFVNNLDKLEACGSMTILSTHDDRVMYIPLHMLYPMQMKKLTFFLSHASNKSPTYECDSLFSYAVVVSKKSLAGLYNKIYNEVYTSDEPSELLQHFMNNNTSDNNDEEGENDFRNDYITNEPSDDKKYVEDCMMQDNELLILYMTETRLVYQGKTGKPFSFLESCVNNNLEQGDVHIPYTTATAIYGTPPFDKEGTLFLKSSGVILQDMIEYLMASLAMPKTWSDLKSFCNFVYGVRSKNSNSYDDDSYQINGNMMAIRLRMTQENFGDMTNPVHVDGYYKTRDACICVQRLFLNMLVGDKTTMNCQFPKRSMRSTRIQCQIDGFGLPVYTGLKQHTLHRSKTYTSFACSLMCMLLHKTSPTKYNQLLKSEITCHKVCDIFSSMVTKKNMATTTSYNEGIGYMCVSDYNQGCSFIGNSTDASTMKDSNDFAKEVNASWITAATTTASEFQTLRLKGENDSQRIKHLFDTIQKVAQYLEREGHGMKLTGRQERQTKLEMEIKEIIKPIISFLGTSYMAIRKSAVYRILMLLTMMYDKELNYREYQDCTCIITQHYHGSYYTTTSINKNVPAEKLVYDREIDVFRNVHEVTGTPITASCKITNFGSKSSMKIKCTASYIDNSIGSDSSSSFPDQQPSNAVISTMSYGGGASGAATSNIISKELLSFIDIWLFRNVYPKLDNKKGNNNLSGVKKRKKLTTFLTQNPNIATALAHFDAGNIAIRSWEDFLDKFITHYMLNKYGYAPKDFGNDTSGGNKPGKHRLLTLIKMVSLPSNNDIVFSKDYLDKDLLSSQGLLLFTRILPTFFTSKKVQQDIYQFRVGESTAKSNSCITDKAIFHAPPNAAFTVVLRGPYANSREMNIQTMFDAMRKMSPTESIKYIHAYANMMCEYVANFYAVDVEDLNAENCQTNVLFSVNHFHLLISMFEIHLR